jgi:hypothetical protein
MIVLPDHSRHETPTMPPSLARRFRVELLREGKWTPFASVQNHRQRLVRLPINQAAQGVRYILDETWGSESSAVFRMSVSQS